MFSVLRRVAVRFGVYDKLRYSRVYEALLKLRNPSYFQHHEDDRQFYGNLLVNVPVKLIFDVGANHGEKATVFAGLAERVICLEPDPRSVVVLQTRFRRSPKVTVVAQAVGAKPGVADLMQDDAGSAYNSLSPKHAQIHNIEATKRVRVTVATLEQLIEQYGIPDFLKVDVEGFEKEVFEGLSTPIKLLCFEANVPQFFDESKTVIERLGTISRQYRFNAVTNDDNRTWAFPNWTAGEEVIQHLSTIKLGSADVFAKLL